MLIRLDHIASIAVYDNRFSKQPGYCQRFAREVMQTLYGPLFNDLHKGSAALSYAKWRYTKFYIPISRGSLPGDLLYWDAFGSNPYGHVAIRVVGNSVAENSIVHNDPQTGGKGFRALADIRKPSGIVRLPPTAFDIRGWAAKARLPVGVKSLVPDLAHLN